MRAGRGARKQARHPTTPIALCLTCGGGVEVPGGERVLAKDVGVPSGTCTLFSRVGRAPGSGRDAGSARGGRAAAVQRRRAEPCVQASASPPAAFCSGRRSRCMRDRSSRPCPARGRGAHRGTGSTAFVHWGLTYWLVIDCAGIQKGAMLGSSVPLASFSRSIAVIQSCLHCCCP